VSSSFSSSQRNQNVGYEEREKKKRREEGKGGRERGRDMRKRA